MGSQHRVGPWHLLLLTSVVSLTTVVLGGAAASAANDYNAGGTRWESPEGGVARYWFDPASPPPAPSQEFESDVQWAFDQYDDHVDAFPLATVEGTSGNHNIRVIWQEIPGAYLGALGAGGSPLRCTDSSPCTMTFDTDPDGSPTWETSTASVGATEYQFRGTAVHEVGHSLGLGHSYGSRRYNGDTINPRDIAMGPAAIGPAGVSTGIEKDTCASMNFQYRGDGVCNRTITKTWSGQPTIWGIDGDTDDPRYFHGWGFASAWEYLSCQSSAVGVTPNNCHWRMRPYPGTATGAFGVIYDLEGAGNVDGTPQNQGMRAGTKWRVRVNVGAPDYNNGSATFKFCVYMRDDSSASQTATWKAGQKCSSWISLSKGQDWVWKIGPYYTLPDDARDDQYLRSYLIMQENGNTLFVSQWEIERQANP